jgi:hypothetical protein
MFIRYKWNSKFEIGHRSPLPADTFKINYIEFEVLTAVLNRSSIIWDMKPCSPFDY